MLERLFSSKTRIKLLDVFLSKPGARLYVRELARQLNEDPKNVSRELDNLEQVGLLSSERAGNLKYYTVDTKFFLFPELKSMIDKTTGVQAVIARALKTARETACAFIFGSHARNRETTASDIDLFVVGTIPDRELHRLIADAERQVAREIQYVLFSPDGLKERVKSKDHFVTEVLQQPKIFVKGDERVLRELAA